MTQRVAIYSRFSTDRQNESSISDQVRVCSEFAAREGWHVVARFDDQGISGAAIGNRPSILRLQHDAFAGRFDVILVTDLSRLSRSQGDLSKMIDRLNAKRIRVLGVQDGYDSERRGHKLQAGLSGIIGEAFREMIKDRTYAALESRAKEKRPTGGRAFGYRDGQVHPVEASLVREIFEKFGEGTTTRAIAADFNARLVPSPGSSWKRTERRASGWLGSAIREMVRNERYRGVIHWNVSEWRKDPDTGRRHRIKRPRSEWITYIDEKQRIIPDEAWERAQQRIQLHTSGNYRSGGKPKLLLSGLLVCDECKSHYTMTDQRSYGCSSYHNGRACSNSIRVRRDRIESILLDPIRKDLLSRERAERMAKEMQAQYAELARRERVRSEEMPRELRDLIDRIDRLRARHKAGDSDMAPDEIEAAIACAEGKRQTLESSAGSAHGTKVFSMLPRAAELYRRQINQGLEGDLRAAQKARVILRELFGGKIRLVREADGGLTAHWNLYPGALLNALGTNGSGGRI